MQEPLVVSYTASIDPPVNVIVEPPEVAASVPPQSVLKVSGDDITTPGGNVSTSGAVKLAIELSKLVNLIVRVDIPPALIVDGLKDFFSEGGMTTGVVTVNVEMAGAALLPLLVCNEAASSELI
jgi:hypothetical protein